MHGLAQAACFVARTPRSHSSLLPCSPKVDPVPPSMSIFLLLVVPMQVGEEGQQSQKQARPSKKVNMLHPLHSEAREPGGVVSLLCQHSCHKPVGVSICCGNAELGMEPLICLAQAAVSTPSPTKTHLTAL